MTDIVVRGAREHNLRGFDLSLPGAGLTVVTGRSGSGKSSLVFDTLHAEGRRRYIEALDLAASGLRRPSVDAIQGLPPTIALRQNERAPSPRETIGSLTQIEALLAVVWARVGVQHDPTTDEAIRPTPHDRIIAELLALPVGSRLLIEAPLLPEPSADLDRLLDEVRRAGFSRVRLRGRVVPIDGVPSGSALDPDVRVVVDRLKVSGERRPRLAEALRLAGTAGRGVIVAHLDTEERVYVDRPFSLSTRRTFEPLRPTILSWRGPGRCPTCDGAGRIDGVDCPACAGERLCEASRFVRYRGLSLPDALSLPLLALRDRLAAVEPDPAAEIALADARDRLDRLIGLELGALPLARRAVELSRGEGQRLRLARAVGQDLSGVLYLLDEPTAGLAPELVPSVLRLLREICARGSAVVAVSHRAELVRAADRVVELGPGAGPAGGEVIFVGGPQDLAQSDTPTGRWLRGELAQPAAPHAAARSLELGVLSPGTPDVALAVEGFTAVTGPAGAGASRLLGAIERQLVARGTVEGIDRCLVVDAARTSSSRSLVATFIGLWDTLRELLAATTEASIRGITASHFSLATPQGRCEACAGQGEVKVDLGLLPPAWVPCEVCDGQRFQRDLLDIVWKGHSAAALLDLSAEEGWRLLAGHPRLERPLRALVDVGLGYLQLGQPTRGLSGGEAARLRLARELSRTARGIAGAALFVDGPTDGLHPVDARETVALLVSLAAAGATVVVATHDPVVLQVANRVVRLVPLAR